MAQLLVCDLGVLRYAEALELQRAVARARIAGAFAEDVLLLVEHPPVVTFGRLAKSEHLLASADVLAARGVRLFETERGGDVTFHGPGQLVGYPVIDLKRHTKDLHWYLRQLEEVLIRSLGMLGIVADRNPGLTGVWTAGKKIASIGVHARDWVTWHGFALNVMTDLSFFDVIVPCGIAGVTMTSVEKELAAKAAEVSGSDTMVGRSSPFGDLLGAIDLERDAKRAVVASMAQVFALGAVPLDLPSLERVAASTVDA